MLQEKYGNKPAKMQSMRNGKEGDGVKQHLEREQTTICIPTELSEKVASCKRQPIPEDISCLNRATEKSVITTFTGKPLKQQLDIETTVCAAQHIKAYFRQCADEEVADWGEPCANCEYVEKCKCNWLARLQPIFTKANISIQLCRQGHFDK